MKLFAHIAGLAGWLIVGSALAQGPSATPADVATPAAKNDANANFWLREAWVPTNDLGPVLDRYPHAVPLSRDQLLTLLHDAHAADPATPDPAQAPPERAVLRLARLEGRLLTGPDGIPQVNVDGTLEVEAFSDGWADVPLGLPGIALGTAELDDTQALGQASLRRTGDGPERPARLQLQGRGVHRLRVGFALPVGSDAAGSFVEMPQVDGAGEFILHLPAGSRADCERGCAMQSEDGGVAARVPLGPTAARLNWRTPPPVPAESGALMQEGASSVMVAAERVSVWQTVALHPALGRLPGEARLALPAGVRAVRVEDVAAGRWSIGADGLRVKLNPSDSVAGFTVYYDLPLASDPPGTVIPVNVPWLEVVGAHRVTGRVFLTRGAGVQVRRVEPGAVATATADRGFLKDEVTVAVFDVADLPAPGAPPPVALTLEARRTTGRFTVDADARADFQLDGVHLERTLAFRVEEGELFTARVHLPPGETLLNIRPAKGQPTPDWRQEGGDILLTWKNGLAEASKSTLVLDTRADLTPPKPGAPTTFSLEAALVPGAERLTGYVALASAPALRLVTTGGEDTLERRDVRTTPVRGDVAWFYREGFRLALRVDRRAAQTEARFTGYALPLAGAVEVHAQIDYRFLFSGVESVKIRVPRDSADAFFFTGKNIAERRRDDDVWTIRFQGEQSGDYALGIQATIPSPADRDDAQRFHFRLPAVVPLDGARWSGAWAVEANTDTEIRFTATGANEADALHAPPLAGYQPTRRVIGVFEFTGGGGTDAAIDLDGVRHPAAGVAAAVVDRLDLETFASTSGVSRHRATLRARTAGDGFFNVRLPTGAALWSLTRDGEPVKPVGGSGAAAGVVRVELPGGRAPANASTVAVIYETPGQPWTGAGKWAQAAPTFDPGVPVVQSSWKLRLPDGFDYRFSEPPHGVSPPAVGAGDLLIPKIGEAVGGVMLSLVEGGMPVFSSVQTRGRALQVENDARIAAVNARLPVSVAIPEAKFINQVTQVKDLLLQAQGFYDSGRYDLAFKRYEQVLTLDPYNNAARKGEEHVELAKSRHANAYDYDETRGRLLGDAKQDRGQAVPKTADKQTDALITAEFKVPPNFFPNQSNGSVTLNNSVNARDFLEASGVTFPPGASATYLPQTGKLVARNTQENIDLIEALIQEIAAPAVTAAPATPPTLSIVPSDGKSDDSLVTAEIANTPPAFISGGIGNSALNQAAVSAATDTTGVGTVTIARQDAKSFLEAQGMTFPPGASATYLASTGKLVVRNTRENLDLLAKITGASQPVTAGSRSGTFGISANAIDALTFGVAPGKEGRAAGLLPLRLELPANGRLYTFEGGGEPGSVEFHYTDWRAAARWRWVCLTLGALGFLAGAAGWAHPWRRTVYVILALTFLPLIVVPSGVATCNALLAGWLWAVLAWVFTRFLLRRRAPLAVAALLCFGALQTTTTSRAQTSATPETVIVPYDATRPVADQKPARYYLPYERFLTLWDAAKQHRRPPVPEPPPGGEAFVLSASRYDARLAGETLEVSGVLDLLTAGEGWVGVPLQFDGLAVAAMTLDGAPATLSGDGKLWVGTPGAHRVNATLRRRMANTAPGTRYSWNVPPTAATLWTLELPRAAARVDLHGEQPGGVIEEIAPDGARRLTASLGGTTRIDLAFRETPPPAPVAGLPALARVEARLVAGTRAETVEVRTRFSFPGGAQDHFTVLIDRTLTLTGLDAPDIKAWKLDTAGERQTLDLTLNTPARDGYAFTLTADRPLPALPATRRAFPVVSARAGRVETVAALRTEGAVELTLADGPPADARRVPDVLQGNGQPFAAFEGNGKMENLVYSVRAGAEKRAAHIDYLYQIGRGKIDLAASARLVPAAGGGPLLTADLRLPPGFAVQAVVGAAVRQWWRDGDVLSVRLAPGAEAALVVYLVRQFDRAPERFTLQPLVAEGFAATDGQAVVAADRAVQVSLDLPTGARAADLSEIDPATAAGEFQVKTPLERQRAFRYRGAAFDVAATLQTQPARWQSQWVTRATVREGTVQLETHVNVAVRQGAVDALDFSLPPGLPPPRVSGTDVRDTLTLPGGDRDRRTCRVLFQNPVYTDGELAVVVSLEIPLGADGRAALPDLTFPETGGGRSEGGFLLVENASEGEMTLDPSRLDPAIEQDVPFLPPQITAGTRFFRAAPDAPWSLGVHVTTLEKTAGRAALVSYAELTSTLRAGGEEWHRATYHLQNRRLQFLPVELPPGMDFIGARVAGESVRVDAGGKSENGAPLLLVPLLKTKPGELSYDVELVYRRPAPSPQGRAAFFERWQLADPTLPGVPIEKTLWNVWLPPDARLLSNGGNVEPALAELNETEKYESALSDLRSLSATFASERASGEERQRAYRNFTSLADIVTRGTTLSLSGRISEGKDQGALFKRYGFAEQSAAVGEKKKEIQHEIDSLNSANNRRQQSQQAQGDVAGDIHDQRYTGRAGFGDDKTRVTVGGMTLQGGNTYTGSTTVNAGWLDNRPADQQQPPNALAGGFVSTKSGQSATVPILSGKQLALNDSLSVDVLVGRDAFIADKSMASAEQTGITLDQNRLSTARSVDRFLAPPAPVPALPAAAPPPEVDAMAKPAPPAPPTEPRGETLRSVGRISLAVDFPQEGQVFHFKKLKADARLTLWTARPERFAPLGWLALLGWVLLLVWAARRRQARRALRL